MSETEANDSTEELMRQFYEVPEIRPVFRESLRSNSRKEFTMAIERRDSMQRHAGRRFRIAIAAALLLGGSVVVLLLPGPNSTLALEEVTRQLRLVPTMSFTEITNDSSRPETRNRVRLMAPNLRRNESDDGSRVEVIDVHQGKILTLSDNGQRVARRVEFRPEPNANVVDTLLQLVGTPDEIASSLPVSNAKVLEERQIDDRELIGFSMEVNHKPYDATIHITVWADKSTKLPYRITCVWKQNGSDREMTQTMEDFDYDPVPKDLFSLEVPEGYTLIENGEARDVEPAEEP